MSKSFWSIALVAASAAVTLAWTADAQQPAPGASYGAPTGGGDLITYFLPAEGKPTTLTIIDPQQRRVAVYHVSRETGMIELKSVRNIAWDLGMDYFNTGGLTPEEIKAMRERTQ
jgi:hypothetical protein